MGPGCVGFFGVDDGAGCFGGVCVPADVHLGGAVFGWVGGDGIDGRADGVVGEQAQDNEQKGKMEQRVAVVGMG